MPHHLLKWRAFKAKDVRGSDIEVDMAPSIDFYYRGKMLSEILQMPLRSPISFHEALHMAWVKQGEACDATKFGSAVGHYNWYSQNFVNWISSLGYHIELTGDEFEILHPSHRSA